MDEVSSSPAPGSSGTPLPPGFKTIEEIQNLSNDQVKKGEIVNVIGFVKDYQPPVATRGTDWKCTLEVKDPSIQYSTYGLKVVIFNAPDKMPKIYGAGDVLLIRKIKVQMYNGTISLLKNQATEFHVIPASQIPRGISEVPTTQWRSFPAICRKPTPAETIYVAKLATSIGQMSLPSNDDFQQKTAQAMKVSDKFGLLKDVQPERWYNILGQVVRIFDGSVGAVTMYVSDYTANSFFYEQTWQEDDQKSDKRERDEYGNNKQKSKADKTWPGPYGKMSIQLTLFDAHAKFARENVQAEQWVFLSNVQMRFGKMGGCLEGYLRSDGDRVGVQIMEQKEEQNENDGRWRDAVRRKRDWWAKFKSQRESFLGEAAKLGEKRKREDEPLKSNAKQRRKERLAVAARKAEVADAKVAEKLDLNENIRCSHPDRQTTSIPSILKRQKYLLNKQNDQEIDLPFVVANYKANVRVVGYYPPRIEDFAVGRRVSEYDMLSDYSGGEDTDHEEFNRSWASGRGAPKKVWEWRFALEVEDAGKKVTKERMWVIVDNASAQCLLDMDAVNLRSKDHMETLQELKEKLCILWGDLEEQKSALVSPDPNPDPVPESSFNSTINADIPSSPPNSKAGAQPNLDSDDENDYVVKKGSRGDPKGSTALNPINPIVEVSANDKSVATRNFEGQAPKIHNKAFSCCIKQYGIKVKEEDPTKATAGNGKRWERKFGLFGAVIV